MIIEIPSQVFSKVTNVTASAAKMGLQVGWMDKILGKTKSKKAHLNLFKKSKGLEKETRTIRPREEITRCLGEIDVEIVYKDYGFHQVFKCRIKVLNYPDR